MWEFLENGELLCPWMYELFSKNQQNSRHKLPQGPVGQAAKENMAREDQTIEYAANAIQLCLQWTFFAKLFRGEHPFADYRTEV